MARTIRTCSVALAVALAAAPALATDGDPLSAYVAARLADARGQPTVAAQGYARALTAHPRDEVIAIRAYRQGLAAGNMALADRAAGVLTASGLAPADADAVALSAALRDGDLAAARAASRRIAAGGLDFLAPVIDAWLALASGEPDPAARLEAAQPNPVGARYATQHRALLLLARDRLDEGAATAQVALAADPAALPVRIASAARLAQRGRREVAARLLTGDTPALVEARRALERRRLGKGAVNASQGVALLLAALARDVGAERGSLLAIALGRSALRLAPGDDATRIALARALAGEKAEAAAIAELARIPSSSSYAAERDLAAAAIRQAMGQGDAALVISARRAGEASADAAAIGAHADLLLVEGRAAEAADAYARAARHAEAAGEPPSWILLFQQGAARERAGDWARARPLLEAALALAPDEPALLNHLGYSQIERGEDMAVAEARIARASALRPDDASIIDSLGWAWFKRGDHARAVPMLEKAARAAPADPEIAEHLGDAYWATGRRFEARYQWRAARIAAETAMAGRLDAKIAGGP